MKKTESNPASRSRPTTRRRLPIGIQPFREIREEGRYCVDKTIYARRLVGKTSTLLVAPVPLSAAIRAIKDVCSGQPEPDGGGRQSADPAPAVPER